MKKLALALLLAGTVSAVAQTEPLPLTTTCTVTAPGQQDQPRLLLSQTTAGADSTMFVQVNAPTKANGKLENVTLKVVPFDAVTTAAGVASNAERAPYVRVLITEGRKGVLNRIRRGDTLEITTGGETISLPLSGSGAAVNAFERCAR